MSDELPGGLREAERGSGAYRASWTVVVLAAAAALLACALPAFELAVIGSANLGDGQRDRYYVREPALVPDLWPVSGVAVVAAVSVLVVGLAALTSRRREGVAVLACLVALFAVFAVASVERQLEWPSGGGAIGYDSKRAGRLLGPTVDDLKADARRSPESRAADFFLVGGEHGFNGRGLIGWSILKGAVAVVWLIAAYRTFRLVVDPQQAAAATAVASVALLVVLFFQALTLTS